METNEFRNPQMADYEGGQLLYSEVMQKSWEDLKHDLRYMQLDDRQNQRKHIWKRLNQHVFIFFAEREFNYNQKVISDYLFIFNHYERIRFAVEDNTKEKPKPTHAIYLYDNHKNGHDESMSVILDEPLYVIFNIGIESITPC